MIDYRHDIRPSPQQIAALYQHAGLKRPVHDLPRLQRMFEGANLVFSAWEGERLVGVLRGWTDSAWVGWIADLAVHPDFQKLGIGKELLRRAIATSPEVTFNLRASDIARDYYTHLGWQKIENGWTWKRQIGRDPVPASP